MNREYTDFRMGTSALTLRLSASFIGVLLGVLGVSAEAQGTFRVVTTHPDFAAIVSDIGGDRVSVESLIRGTEDPHYVDARPTHVIRVSRADLLVCIGMELEDGWLPVLLRQSRNRKVQVGSRGHLDASQFISPKQVPTVVDRAMGDVHGAGNPHYYNGPIEMRRVAEGIYRRMVELDPTGSAVYDSGWNRFRQAFDRRIQQWQEALAPLSGSRVIEYHASWVYLLDWMGFVSVGTLEPKPGIPPSPRHVSRLLQQIGETPVQFVFREIYHADNLSVVFARKASARLVTLPTAVGATPDVRTLLDKWDRIVQMLTGTSSDVGK